MAFFESILAVAGISTQRNVAKICALKEAIAESGKINLLGSTARERVEVDMWLTFSIKNLTNDCLSALNNTLLHKTFLVGNSLSLADYAVFCAVSKCDLSGLSNVRRWYNFIGTFSPSVTGKGCVVGGITHIPVALFDEVNAPTSSSQRSAQTATSDAAPEGKAAAAIAEKPKAEAADSSSLDPTKLDIRCGFVVKCWNHPDSDKLLCEEVDLGGGEIRSIASGLRAFYSAEQLQGRKVVVLANLKERSMAGFKSQGMVLCAVSKDHSVVRLLEVPEGTKVGERVTFPGFPADSVPATPAQMVKKKILEELAPGLRTDSAGVAHWSNSAFTIGGGVCSAPGVADAVVS